MDSGTFSDYAETFCNDDDHVFIYMNVKIVGRNVTALLDTGSSVNIMSYDLFKALPTKCKSCMRTSDISIVLAKGQKVNILGIATVSVQTSGNPCKHNISVYILKESSHPLILGTKYYTDHSTAIDFSKFGFNEKIKKVKIRCKYNVSIAPNSESVVYGILPRVLTLGIQGVCHVHNELLREGLLFAKTVVTVNSDCTVPLKIFNPSPETVHVSKGIFLAYCHLIDNTYDITPCFTQSPHINNVHVNNTHGITSCVPLQAQKQEADAYSFKHFSSQFNINKNLDDDQHNAVFNGL